MTEGARKEKRRYSQASRVLPCVAAENLPYQLHSEADPYDLDLGKLLANSQDELPESEDPRTIRVRVVFESSGDDERVEGGELLVGGKTRFDDVELGRVDDGLRGE